MELKGPGPQLNIASLNFALLVGHVKNMLFTPVRTSPTPTHINHPLKLQATCHPMYRHISFQSSCALYVSYTYKGTCAVPSLITHTLLTVWVEIKLGTRDCLYKLIMGGRVEVVYRQVPPHTSTLDLSPRRGYWRRHH